MTTPSEAQQEALHIGKAILLFLIESRLPESRQRKAEILLHRAGLSYKDIAGLLGKKEDAIRKAVERSKP